MYIYIVFLREKYENSQFMGAFCSKEKADNHAAYLQRNSSGFSFDYYIDKVELK